MGVMLAKQALTRTGPAQRTTRIGRTWRFDTSRPTAPARAVGRYHPARRQKATIDMNPAQAARQTPEQDPVIKPQDPVLGKQKDSGSKVEVEAKHERFEPGSEQRAQRRDDKIEVEESEFEESDLGDEEDVGEVAIRVLSRARRRIREQPLTAATGAFIIGFAFGNGVPKFLARAGIAIGLRLVMQRMFERPEMFEADD
jgi:hypothetical protein